jgi:cytochrome P450
MPAVLPPGPRGSLLTGHLAELRRDSLGFYTRCTREFGDFITLRFGWKRVFLINHPDLIERVLVTDARNFTKHFGLRMNRRLLGNGLLTSEGDFWLRQRRLIQPAFLRERVAGYGPDMVALADKMVASWRGGETRDIHADMTRLTLEIAAKTMFGVDFTDGAGAAMEGALADIADTFRARFYSLFRLPDAVPTPANLRLRRAVRRLDDILFGLIEQRRNDVERSDLLSILLRARGEGNERMTDRQLRDEAMTLFLAGHDTTALTLSWGLYLLAQHPEVTERLTTELHDVLAGRLPTVQDLPRLRYTDMVVHEVMRLYPAAYVFGRQAIAACELGGYHLPAGATVLMSQWVMHRDPRFWDAPEKFRPERWADGLAQRLPKFAYFPFGGGPRLCIGNAFALLEAALVLATIVQRFRFTRVPGPEVRPRPTITLRPERGIDLLLHAQSYSPQRTQRDAEEKRV